MNQKESKAHPPATTQDFPIVGLGASAGGLDAFKQFLGAVPQNSGMAYVLVQHLYASHESILPEILSKYTTIPVLEITDDIHLAPNHIYVIPENKILTSIDGVLKLSAREKESKNAAIDIFFVSLAEVHLNLAVGIILSGTGTDGILGLKAIKKYGGITFAQDEGSAVYSQMPLNAINAQTVDYVLRPDEMPAKLVELMIVEENPEVNIPKDDESIYRNIISLVRKSTNVDFTYYKQNTIQRRIARRMALSKCTGLNDYLTFLNENDTAPVALLNDLLIPVTSFFRDPKIFDEIKQNIFPALAQRKNNADSIRIWIAGCSTGQEAYSFAIALHEFMEGDVKDIPIQIFASDISEISIATARAGFYKSKQVTNVPEAVLKKYFIKKEDGYQVKRNIRDLCVFAVHNFLKDPPFARMDLISCRNVLIYMDTFIQKKALTTFHYALSGQGFLLLGKSETTALVPELFTPELKTSRVYSRKSSSGRFIHQGMREKEGASAAKKNQEPAGNEIPKTDFIKSAQAILLSDFIPASVIINEHMEIVHINGNIVPFIELSQGKPTFNLLKIARSGLVYELRNALRTAKDLYIPVVKEGIPIKHGNGIIEVTIEVRPLENSAEPHFLVVFKQATIPQAGNTKMIGLIQGQINNENINLKRISHLEKELLQTQAHVNSIAEEHEASNEELQSANEELQSSSEELQSLNEELETSKEELQSSNEELIFVNSELVNKQEEIITSKKYIESIVATLREPIVVLDKDLRIRNINRAFVTKYIISKEEAKGKMIYDICNGVFKNSLMRSMLEKVLQENMQLYDYEISLNLRPDAQSILLLNAREVDNEDGKEQLILLAIEDITERKTIERSLKILSDSFEVKVKERTAELEATNTELELSVRKLHSANIRLSQFSNVASHDLQEPLRKIQTFISILRLEESTSEQAVKLLNKIDSSSGRMKTLINDLLAYSYLNNDNELFVTTDLNKIVKDILIDFELLIVQKNVEVTCGMLPVLPAIPLQMNQLFCNLLSNALKFLRTDNLPRIEIAGKDLLKADLENYPLLDKELSWCEIIVTDNGIGFDQKYDKQIFTIFQRLHTTEVYQGTGIGLAISHKIVENHGGIIFVESTLNNGASFHIILPKNRITKKPRYYN